MGKWWLVGEVIEEKNTYARNTNPETTDPLSLVPLCLSLPASLSRSLSLPHSLSPSPSLKVGGGC